MIGDAVAETHTNATTGGEETGPALGCQRAIRQGIDACGHQERVVGTDNLDATAAGQDRSWIDVAVIILQEILCGKVVLGQVARQKMIGKVEHKQNHAHDEDR